MIWPQAQRCKAEEEEDDEKYKSNEKYIPKKVTGYYFEAQ